MTTNTKPIIYQLIPRLFTNYCDNPVPGGTIGQNGSGKLNSITPAILKEIKKLGATHIWYTGVIEHAHDADYTLYGIPRHNPHVVKGHAGSPYAITDYYDIDPDLAEDVPNRIGEFEALVKRTKEAGLKTIIDFVPNHVARQYASDAKPRGIRDLGEGDNKEMFFDPRNNFYYITRQQFTPIGVDLGSGPDAYIEFPSKASGDDCYNAFPEKNNWYDTVKLNYGVDPWNGSRHFNPIPPTWYKMLNILRYWAAKGVDGFRCDMAHMVPIEFWHWAIDNVHERYPNIVFIAEIYDVSLYRPFIDYGRFDYLYDKVNLYDTLYGIEVSNVSAAKITSCWQTVEGIGEHMLNFLENHDEVRFASPQYAGDPTHAMPALVVSAMLNRGPMMIYAGQELGETAAGVAGYSGDDGRTTIFDYYVIPTIKAWLNKGACDGELTPEQQKLRSQYALVLGLCNKEKAISEGRFFDLMYVNLNNPSFNPHRQFAFLRYTGSTALLIAVNFADADADARIIIPAHAMEAMEAADAKVRCTELISGITASKTVSSQEPFHTPIPAHGAVIWKFHIKKSEIKEPSLTKKS